MTIALTCKTTNFPDFSGYSFYVEAGKHFDADDYAETRSLLRTNIDDQDIKHVQDSAARLEVGEWLLVDHDDNQVRFDDEA